MSMWKRAWTKDNSFHSSATPTVFDRPQRSFSANIFQFSSLGQKFFPNLKKCTKVQLTLLHSVSVIFSPFSTKFEPAILILKLEVLGNRKYFSTAFI